MVLGSVGVWGTGLWLEESRRAEAKDVAAELDELGYAALWLSAGFGRACRRCSPICSTRRPG